MTNKKNYLTKKDVVEAYSQFAKISKTESLERVNSLIEFVKNTMIKDDVDGLQIVDFLCLKKVHRSERIGKHPATKEEITIPASTSLKVKLGKSFKDLLNNK